MSSIAAKRWSVSCQSVADEPLRIYYGEKPLTQSAPATLDEVSPVQILLVSVATCFALSCRAALRARRLPLGSLEVRVSGEKALEKPSRLALIQVGVRFGDRLTEEDAAAVARDAKALCTVTNTLVGLPVIELGIGD
jgi:uncharacterized OsmC-like protein